VRTPLYPGIATSPVRLGLSSSTLDALIKTLKIRENRFKFPQATGEFTIFSVLPQFHELPHGAAIFPPHSFQLLHDGLAFAFPKSENTDAVLVRKARADGMQG